MHDISHISYTQYDKLGMIIKNIAYMYHRIIIVQKYLYFHNYNIENLKT